MSFIKKIISALRQSFRSKKNLSIMPYFQVTSVSSMPAVKELPLHNISFFHLLNMPHIAHQHSLHSIKYNVNSKQNYTQNINFKIPQNVSVSLFPQSFAFLRQRKGCMRLFVLKLGFTRHKINAHARLAFESRLSVQNKVKGCFLFTFKRCVILHKQLTHNVHAVRC